MFAGNSGLVLSSSWGGEIGFGWFDLVDTLKLDSDLTESIPLLLYIEI